MKDLEHPFLDPLWRRVLIVALLGGWCIYEFTLGSEIWGMLFVAATVVCAKSFFYDRMNRKGGNDG